MPAIKKSNVSVRLKKNIIPNLLSVNFTEYWFETVQPMLSASFSSVASATPIPATPIPATPIPATPIPEKKVYELYYKDALICEDTDKNKLRRMGYLIRKNLDN
jgi:hypothetical protein